MKREIFICQIFCMIALLVLNSCASTDLKSTLNDTGYHGPLKKVLIIGVFREGNIKRYFEDELANRLKARGTDAVPSFTVFPEETILTREAITGTISELGMDAVLVTRPLDVLEAGGYETYPTRVNPGDHFYDYYVLCCQTAVYEGYVIMLETKLFEAKYDKLLWSAISETSLKHNARAAVDSFIDAAMKDLSDKRLIR